VRAAKIESIESLGDNWLLCFTVNGKQAAYPITTRWLERHEPKLGGYFVAYADGYTSYSPADAFEGGYVLDV
jgi:hypothetical protein